MSDVMGASRVLRVIVDLVDQLEEQCSWLWGPTQFDWTIGRTADDDGRDCWFWYCGTVSSLATRRTDWAYGGKSDTLGDALQAIIDAHAGKHPPRHGRSL